MFQVIYTVQGFVDKNKDAQQDVFFELLAQSENDFVGDLTRLVFKRRCVKSGKINTKICLKASVHDGT